MAWEPEDLAEIRRELGAQLTIFRVAAELTQGQLAQAACCDRTNVAHIEKGRSRGDERFWTIADELCGAEGALLAGFHAMSAAKQAHEVQVREAQLAESRAKVQALRLTLRREAIALAAKIAVGAGLTSADRAILDAPVTASPVPARIGGPDVARVAATTRCLMAQDKAFGGGCCRDAVFGHLSWARQLREASASEDVQRALEAALARLENLAGWTSHDLCLPLSAQRCYLRSLESARRAEEPILAAHALGTLGGLYLQAGHFPEALQLFRLGALPVQDVASPGMLAGLVLSEAQAHAGLGSIDEVERALRRAEEHYARAQEAPDEWVGTVVLPDHSDLPAGRANAYSRLARHDQRFAETAVIDMTAALGLRDPGRARAMLSARITLATNQYRCGETDFANTITEQVLASINQVSSRRTTRDLITLGTEIRHYTTDSTAQDLAHRIRTDIAA
jgi:DNA-binding XRE family transcriptional regulator